MHWVIRGQLFRFLQMLHKRFLSQRERLEHIFLTVERVTTQARFHIDQAFHQTATFVDHLVSVHIPVICFHDT